MTNDVFVLVNGYLLLENQLFEMRYLSTINNKSFTMIVTLLSYFELIYVCYYIVLCIFFMSEQLLDGMAKGLSNKNVFVSICPKNFYQQCFPRGSVCLGISFTAMHWLQKR